MEQGRAAAPLVDTELHNLLVGRDLQIIEGLLFDEGIIFVSTLKELCSNHGAWFQGFVDRIRKCASLDHAKEFEMLGKAVSGLIEESYISNQRPCGTMPSSDLSNALKRKGLESTECFLCLNCGVHSLECLRALPASAFQDIRAQLLNAGYGPGHAEGLKLLRQEVCGQYAMMELSSGGALIGERSLTLGDTTEYQTSLHPTGVIGEAASSTPRTPGPQNEQGKKDIVEPDTESDPSPPVEVVEATEKVMQRSGQKHSTVAHCCTALSQRAVLGVATSTSTFEKNKGLLPTMQKFLSAQKDDSLRSDCVRVLARCQPLPDLLDLLGDDELGVDEFSWHKALDEVFKGLNQQITLSICSAPDDDAAFASQSVLLKLSRQRDRSNGTCPSAKTLVSWVDKEDDIDQQRHRFKLIGILFGVKRTLLDPSFYRLDFGREKGHLDEVHVTNIFLALIDLKFLDLVQTVDADKIVEAISDPSAKVNLESCNCAYYSVHASLLMILEIDDWYPNLYSFAGVIYEYLRASSILFKNLGTTYASHAIDVAERVLKKYYQWEWSKDTRVNEYKALHLAKTLLAAWRGRGSSAEEGGEAGTSTVDSMSESTSGLPPLDEADSDES